MRGPGVPPDGAGAAGPGAGHAGRSGGGPRAGLAGGCDLVRRCGGLRLAAGLHALVLSGADPRLAAAYADPGVTDSQLRSALAGAFADHAPLLLHWLDNPPQTNEVRRSAVLIAAGHWLAQRVGMPMVLSELGASAGLNLLWDRFALDLPGASYGPPDAPVRLAPHWTGPLPPATPPVVAARAGVDLNPLDPKTDRLRLLSYIWAGQDDRLARTRAAADLAAGFPGLVARGDAVDWLERRLATPFPGQLHLVFHTIAWQYFPAAAQARGAALLAAAGARATAQAPLAHLSMEADATPGSAAVTLTLWPGGATLPLAAPGFTARPSIGGPDRLIRRRFGVSLRRQPGDHPCAAPFASWAFWSFWPARSRCGNAPRSPA